MWVRCFLLVSLLVGGCAPPPPVDPSLAQLERVARHLTSTRHLRLSAYGAVRETGTPSELVSFLFSDVGVAEWPAAVSGSAMEREQMQSTRTPMFPEDGTLVHGVPDPRIGRQLVLRGDDATGEIVAEGYLDAKSAPVLRERWPMPEFRQ